MGKTLFALFLLCPLCLFSDDASSKLQEIEQEFNDVFSDSYSIGWKNTEIAYLYYYEGSEIPEAYLTLYSNGVAVLESRMMSENYAELKRDFHLYSIESDLITFKLIDYRYNIGRLLNGFQSHVEKKTLGAVSVDFKEKTVTVLFEKNLFFFGLRFYRE